MYQLNQDQIDSLENFIGKLEDSMIKSHIEKWFAEITPTNRVTAEQMEKFVSFSTHLPKEVQNFPQAFAQAVKNTPEAEKREAKEPTGDPVNLTAIADDSISNVDDVDAPDDEEDTLHTLGKIKKKKAVSKKAVSKSGATSKPEQKSGSQKSEEDDIIKRNKQVDEKQPVQKPIVIVQKGK